MTSIKEVSRTPEAEPPVESQPAPAIASDKDLEQFLRENNNALVSYVYSWVRSRPDALDIVQEAYCRIFRMENLSAVGHLRGYLFKTARNIATDWVRQRVVREAFVQEEPLRGNTEAASPEQIWLARERLEALQLDVEALPPKCQLALVMVRLDGASYEEVANCLSIKTHSARRLVERALEYLLESESDGQRPSQTKRGRKAKKGAGDSAVAGPLAMPSASGA